MMLTQWIMMEVVDQSMIHIAEFVVVSAVVVEFYFDKNKRYISGVVVKIGG